MALGRVYAKLPVLAQHGAVSAYGVYWYWQRFGPGFRSAFAEFQARERWSAQAWAAWQRTALTAVLSDAAAHVPYYRRTWTVAEKRAAAAGELGDIPLLTKEPLRADPLAFLDERVPRRGLITSPTSGSTGTPISVLWRTRELRRSMALREARLANWAGVSFRQRRATFSGRMVEPDPRSAGPFYRFNAVERQVYFSPFHLRADTAPHYVEALRRHRVAWMTGYAVSFYLLASFMLDLGLPPVPTVKAVVTTSEKVTAPMRATIERAFACPVFEEYSTVDNVLFASECEHRHLHVSPDVGVVEILRPDGRPCLAGEVGEVVATGVMRVGQPFVRFRLGDLAAWSDEACACGRAMPILAEVSGRVEDVVIGPDGRQMVRFHGVFVDQPRVREGQIVQEALDRIRVKVVTTPDFSAVDRRTIVERVQQRLGPDVHVEVEVVASIPRSAAGKFQAVVSHVRSGPAAP